MPHSFTPGPWETLKFSQHELQTDFAMVKIGKRVHMIGYSDEDKANAHLIAAAPELLEALCDFSEYVHNEQCSTDGAVQYSTTQINRLVFKARDAIAKAGGES